MIETRYKVVNKWLREIRDIDVQESSVKGSSGSFGVTTPLHCKAGEYLNTNLTFHHNSFQTSLNSGLLRTYLQNGDIIQVYYDTVAKKEVDSPFSATQTVNNQQDDQVTAMAKLFNESGITANDLKDLIGLLKEKKNHTNATINKTNTQTDTASNISINSNIQKAKTQKTKRVGKKTSNNTKIQKSVKIEPNTPIQPKDNGAETEKNKLDNNNQIRYNKQTVDPEEKAIQVMFNNFSYQQRLNYIKEVCDNINILKWIQANFHQTAIFNAVSNKIQVLESK